MPKILFILVFAFCTVHLHAQDTLYRTDGSHQVVNVLEINKTQIKYKPFSNPDAPIYVILNTAILKIVDKNGTTTTFTSSINPSDNSITESSIPNLKTLSGSHFISMNIADLFTGLLTLNYEYTLESGKLGLKVPLTTGFYTLSGSYNQIGESYFPYTTIFGTGIGLNFYPRGQRSVTYFIGPAFYYRSFNYSVADPGTYIYNNKVGSFTSFFIQNGVLFHAGTRLNLSMDAGLGYAWINTSIPYYSDHKLGYRLKIGINVGFKL